jgi:hypothetical protein
MSPKKFQPIIFCQSRDSGGQIQYKQTDGQTDKILTQYTRAQGFFSSLNLLLLCSLPTQGELPFWLKMNTLFIEKF